VFADTLPNVANTFTFPGCKPVRYVYAFPLLSVVAMLGLNFTDWFAVKLIVAPLIG